MGLGMDEVVRENEGWCVCARVCVCVCVCGGVFC